MSQPATSYSNIHGEWEQRKISIWGAARAFITNLRVGQDMTRITIPALFLRPYSILEEIATRMACKMHLLHDVPSRSDPIERMKGVVSWLICTAQAENFNHKPYNPILGEIHKARIDYDDGSTTFILVEQVEHHPPAAAFTLINKTHGVIIEGNWIFDVTFHGNSVTIRTLGGLKIKLDTPDGREEYHLEKGVPDLLVKNVILGTKYVFWTGDLKFDCKKTKHQASISISYESNKNIFTGKIGQVLPDDTVVDLIYLDGVCGFKTHSYNLDDKGAPIKKSKALFCDAENQPTRIPVYPLYTDLTPNNSIKLWEGVSKAIVENNMAEADRIKNEIEEAQRESTRIREEKGEAWVPVYYARNERGFWYLLDEDWFLQSSDINPNAETNNNNNNNDA